MITKILLQERPVDDSGWVHEAGIRRRRVRRVLRAGEGRIGSAARISDRDDMSVLRRKEAGVDFECARCAQQLKLQSNS